MFQLLFSSLFIGLISAGCSVHWPNNTETSPHWWQCGGAAKISSATPQDANGNYIYPIPLSKPFDIVMDYMNPKGITYQASNLKLSVYLFQYNIGFGGCGWDTIPTFGLLNRLNACNYGVPCPLTPAQQKIKFELDLDKDRLILNSLEDDITHMFEYHLVDSSLGEVACLDFQAHTINPPTPTTASLMKILEKK